MSDDTVKPPGDSRWLKPEVRYSLKELLGEVQAERQTGAFGNERLRQTDISQLFEAKPRPSAP